MTFIKTVLSLGAVALIGALCVSSVSVQAQTMSSSVSSSNSACIRIVKQIRKGSRGADVLSLQQFLIAKGLLSADSNTGYFGNLTASAVVRFQAQSGLETVGSVGPRTLGLINAACVRADGSANMGNSNNMGSPVQADATTNAHLVRGMQLGGITADKLKQPPTCVNTVLGGDLNNDGTVDMWDLVILARNYDLPAGQLMDPMADKNGNNDVEFYEALKVAQDFGKTTNCTNPTNTTQQTTDTTTQATAGAMYAGISPSMMNKAPVCTTESIWAGDLNNDGKVDMWDLAILGNNYNLPAGYLVNPAADKNGNNDVDFYEALMVGRFFGFKSCSTTTTTQTTTQNNVNTSVVNTTTSVDSSGDTTSNTTNNTVPAQPTADQQQAIGYAVQFNISQDGLFNDPTSCTTNNINMGDLDSNGKVNWWDLVLLGRNYNKPAGQLVDPTADKNGDGLVNFSELLGVSQNWMKVSCPANNNSSSAQSSS